MKQSLNTVAIDLAKKVFHLAGADTTGKSEFQASSGGVFTGAR